MSTLNILRGEETAPLLIEPLSLGSVAMNVSTVIPTDKERYRIPKITEDPTTDWVGESEDLPETDVAGENVSTKPRKVGGIVFIPNELAEDTSPGAADIIASRLAQGVIPRVDQAFFGLPLAEAHPDYNPERPEGLESITEGDLSLITGDPADPDTYIDAIAAAEDAGADITAWVMHKSTALALAKLKVATGSKVPLLPKRELQEIPYRTSRYVTPGTVWGIPKSRAATVVRKDTELSSSRDFGFRKDQLAIRVIARVGFLFPSTASIIKIKKSS